MQTAEECEDHFEALGVPEGVYAPLVALFRDPYYGAKVYRRDDGVLIGELNIAAIEDACRPIIEWMRSNGLEVPREIAN